jgi:hypothetical protein
MMERMTLEDSGRVMVKNISLYPNKMLLNTSIHTGGGSYACWFATQLHCVKPVQSGRRVVAGTMWTNFIRDSFLQYVLVYNLSVGSDTNWSCRAPPKSVLCSAHPYFALIGPDAMARIMSFLDLTSLSRFCCITPQLAACCSYEFLLTTYLKSNRAELARQIAGIEFHKLGFMLRHQYSFDGLKSVPWSHLRGRDAVIYCAFRDSFGVSNVSTVECCARFEVRAGTLGDSMEGELDDVDDDREHNTVAAFGLNANHDVLSVRIFHGFTDPSEKERDDDEDEEDGAYHYRTTETIPRKFAPDGGPKINSHALWRTGVRRNC